MYIDIYICIFIHTYTYIDVYTHIYIYTNCMYIDMYTLCNIHIYIYIDRDRYVHSGLQNKKRNTKDHLLCGASTSWSAQALSTVCTSNPWFLASSRISRSASDRRRLSLKHREEYHLGCTMEAYQITDIMLRYVWGIFVVYGTK